jgi:crotonobetainyl-CoA:carnitine CoA-transferase CaiB-like acyl-CoA transferase
MLNGLRVLDLSRVLAGPLCTMMLGDLGADVLKVERPGAGDDTRTWGPPFAADGQSAYFRSVNRNKLSVALDLDAPSDRTTLRTLLADADVVVENYLPGALARKGLDAAALLHRHPQLVWCTIGGFAADPMRPGYDFVVQAESGWMSITGAVDGSPNKVGVALADVIAGKDAAAAVLAALWARERRGSAGLPPAERHIRINLMESAVAALVNVAQNVLVSGRPAARWGNGHPNLVPYDLFEAADGPFVLAVGNDAQWLATVAAIGFDGGTAGGPDDGRWATNAARVEGRAELLPLLAAHFATAPASAWLAKLAAAGVPAGVVRPVHDALATVTAHARTGVAPATGGSIRRPPPALDAHGALVRTHGWQACALVAPDADASGLHAES